MEYVTLSKGKRESLRSVHVKHGVQHLTLSDFLNESPAWARAGRKPQMSLPLRWPFLDPHNFFFLLIFNYQNVPEHV